MVDRRNLSLYEFYRDVGLRFQSEVLGIQGMTSHRRNHLNQVLGQLQNEYFGHGAIEYGDPDRVVAYTLSFAPKTCGDLEAGRPNIYIQELHTGTTVKTTTQSGN